MHSRNEVYQEAFDDSVFGISMPSASSYVLKDTLGESGLQQESSRQLQMSDETPPVRTYAQSTTPSTRYTDSPFSHVPTPSSASSYSPGVTATSGSSARFRQQSPTRDRSTINSHDKKKPDTSRLGLPPVRELSSSSSNSTVKPLDFRSVPTRKAVPRKTPSAPLITQAPPTSRASSKAINTTKPGRPVPPEKVPVQVPPELAHLNVDLPSNRGIHKPLPPIRPSRDGAISISDMSRPSPVVQSDLSRLYTTYHKRTPSQETPISPSAPSPSFRSRFGLTSRSSSRQQSPRVDSAISPPPSARTFSRGPTPEVPKAETRRSQRTDSPALGPAPSPSKSPRFGLFSRKTRSDVSKATEKPKRLPIKGPVAGTGHEGYGRFGFRGRSGSTTSSTGNFRSPSADSNVSSARPPLASRNSSFGSSKDGSELDDFLKERLTPVILRGCGSATSANISIAEKPLIDVYEPSSSSSLDSYPKPQLLPSAMQGNRGISPAIRPHLSTRVPSDSSEDDPKVHRPTLATRRSLTRLSQADGRTVVRVPAQINTNLTSHAQDADSYDANTSAWLPSARQPPVMESHKGGMQPQQSEDHTKPLRKWNFLQRAHASPRPKGKAKVDTESPNSGPHHAPYRAYYTMLEPAEPVDLYEVEQILQENETSAEDSTIELHLPSKIVPYERRHSGLLPSPSKADMARNPDFRAETTPPMISVQRDFAESPELLRASQSLPRQTPHIVDIPKSPLPPSPVDDVVPHKPMLEAPQAFSTPEMPQTGFGTPNMLHENESPRQPRLSPLLDIADNDDHEQSSHADLRFGALMTSKWLSFGRVLFSPAHHEMRLSDEPRVLVLDGLGSDWSHYVALSYPAAHVYNLGPAVVNGSTSWLGINQKPPPNHRHIPHSAISAAFPFPKGFFTAVVFRFPSATTDAAYHACIFECKRVLKPGGHLEVAVLDLDLMNMGTRARSLVRGLKTQMHQCDQSVSLRNLSDVLVRLIGRRGFEEVQRCIVGVPAAGRIPRSGDISSAGSENSAHNPRPHRELRHSDEKKISFADLLETARHSQVEPTRSHDEGITKMVAKVGRWWYSRCYETPLLETNKSIWDDPTLLRECEKQGTSFRLLICYAQKPTQAQRRTVSV
ncbi:hypothetical protein LTR08_008289 [Meristemomyces frigidus]|nr:hypothetical protein LTR08_008289 [Meristemomyces frigidus]